MSSVLVWVLMIFGWSLSAQWPTLLNEQPEYSLHNIYAWSLQSWSTNTQVEWRNGYCSLIARKNQEQIAKLVWSDYRALRWHAIDIIDRWRQDRLRFREWDRSRFEKYIGAMNDSMIDVYSYVLEDDDTVSNPETFSYRSPHRFTLIKYRGNIRVLDPLRGSKSTQVQSLKEYLHTTNTDHYFLIPKRDILLWAMQLDVKPAVVYENSLLNSLVRHTLHGYIQPLQWSESNTIRWVVFQKPFQYVNMEWDVLIISKDTIVRLETLYGPMVPRVFGRWEGTVSIFHSWDRFSTPWSIKKYE